MNMYLKVQTGLKDWMIMYKSNMPLLDHAHLMVEKPIIMVECCPEQEKISTPLVELDPEKEDSVDNSEEMTIPFSVLVLRAGRGVAELLVDPVYHGWRKVLRIICYLQSWSSIHKHKTHREIPWECKICMLGRSL